MQSRSGLFIFLLFAFQLVFLQIAFAASDSSCTGESCGTPAQQGFGVCGVIDCADSVSDCASRQNPLYDSVTNPHVPLNITPANCLFLEEPIGGQPRYDLYYRYCIINEKFSPYPICSVELWSGELITYPSEGPIQAILSYKKEREFSGSLDLLSGYTHLIYQFLSGLVVGFAVLSVVVGGIQMTVSAGGEGIDKGRHRIIQALIGTVLWFLASLLLFTINPTFFSF